MFRDTELSRFRPILSPNIIRTHKIQGPLQLNEVKKIEKGIVNVARFDIDPILITSPKNTSKEAKVKVHSAVLNGISKAKKHGLDTRELENILNILNGINTEKINYGDNNINVITIPLFEYNDVEMKMKSKILYEALLKKRNIDLDLDLVERDNRSGVYEYGIGINYKELYSIILKIYWMDELTKCHKATLKESLKDLNLIWVSKNSHWDNNEDDEDSGKIKNIYVYRSLRMCYEILIFCCLKHGVVEYGEGKRQSSFNCVGRDGNPKPPSDAIISNLKTRNMIKFNYTELLGIVESAESSMSNVNSSQN